MKVTLHKGAHRTATTSFQHYLSENSKRLRALGICAIGPDQTRGALLTGIVPQTDDIPAQVQLDQAQRRLALYLSRLRSEDVTHLVVSDENMIGAVCRNLHMQGL